MMNNRNSQPLDNAQLMRMAPSAFARQPFHQMSQKYQFIPTSNVIDGMRQSGFMPVQASESRTRVEGAQPFVKHMIRFRSMDQAIENLGDEALEVVLINSANGTSRYILMAGVFRLVCSNGLVVASSLVGSLRVRHIGEDVIKQVVGGSHEILSNTQKVRGVIDAWKRIQLAPAEQLALAESAHEIRFEEPTAITPAQLLTLRRHDDASSDLWTTFNRIQENTLGGNLRAISVNPDTHVARRVRTREIKNIDGNVKLNQALWTLAEKMAELKQAA